MLGFQRRTREAARRRESATWLPCPPVRKANLDTPPSREENGRSGVRVKTAATGPGGSAAPGVREVRLRRIRGVSVWQIPFPMTSAREFCRRERQKSPCPLWPAVTPGTASALVFRVGHPIIPRLTSWPAVTPDSARGLIFVPIRDKTQPPSGASRRAPPRRSGRHPTQSLGPSVDSGHHVPNAAEEKKAKRLRAILRAPEVVQPLYREGVTNQTAFPPCVRLV